MKTEITIENKARFFAQYWGQPLIGMSRVDKQYAPIEGYPLDNYKVLEDCFLELKPLSQITDEDAIEVARLQLSGTKEEDIKLHFDPSDPEFAVCTSYHRNDYYEVVNSQSYQYLQSKGYALPWMGLSVNEMVKVGWIKLN